MSKIYDWFEERLEIQAIADDISSKYVPPHVNIFYCIGGITFTGVTWRNTMFVAGSGGPIVVTNNPRISAGSNVGQELILIGTNDTNYLDISDGNGVITGGLTIRLGLNSIATFIWNGTNWMLKSANGLIP